MSEIGHLNPNNLSTLQSNDNNELGKDAAIAAAKAAVSEQDRAAHIRQLEEEAKKLEHDNELRRQEKAAEERLHRAEKEQHDLEHPMPWPLNLLHTQADGEHVTVAAADAGHANVIDATAADHGDAHAEVVAHADDHGVTVAAGHDTDHVVDHSHDAVDSGAA